jgi:hypothetical protein
MTRPNDTTVPAVYFGVWGWAFGGVWAWSANEVLPDALIGTAPRCEGASPATGHRPGPA